MGEHKYKVGDRVRCKGNAADQFTKGKIYEVRDVTAYSIGIVEDDSGATNNGWGHSHWEPAPLFAVGDKVRHAQLTETGDGTVENIYGGDKFGVRWSSWHGFCTEPASALELAPEPAPVAASNDNAGGGLRIEDGKTYRDAKGACVGPMTLWNRDVEHPWSWDRGSERVDQIYRGDGTSDYNPRLVAEWGAPATNEGKFKVGDRVTRPGVSWSDKGNVITKIEGDTIWLAPNSGGRSYPYTIDDDFTLVSPLTIQAGRFYKTRDGRKVGPMEAGEQYQLGPWYFKCGNNHFQKDGFSCFGGDGNAHRLEDDLIAEWPAEHDTASTADVTIPLEIYGGEMEEEVDRPIIFEGGVFKVRNAAIEDETVASIADIVRRLEKLEATTKHNDVEVGQRFTLRATVTGKCTRNRVNIVLEDVPGKARSLSIPTDALQAA